MDGETIIQCTPFHILVEDKCEGEESLEIHLWCHDKKSCPVLVRVQNFPAIMYLELPKIVKGKKYKWKKEKVGEIMEKLGVVLEKDNHVPIFWSLTRHKKLHYYQTRPSPMILVAFESEDAMRHCKNFCMKCPIRLGDNTSIMLQPLEYDITTTRKFFTTIKAEYSSWIEVKGNVLLPDDDDRLSRKGSKEFPITEICAETENVKAIPSSVSKTWLVYPRLVSMDIEVNSSNIKAFPNEYKPEDVIFNISVIYQQFGKPETRRRICLVLKGTSQPSNGEIRIFKTEIELLKGYGELIQELDPDIIIGFNIFGFDNKYIHTRLNRVGEPIPDMGRMINRETTHKKITWKSSGYGVNNIHLINAPGRIAVDLLPLVRRDYKLDKYSLEVVSQHFLGRGKHDVKAQEMFIAYQNIEKYENNQEKLLQAYDNMKRIVEYCIEDSELVMDLFHKLNVWFSLKEMSNIMGVTIMELFTRGQRVRVQSLVYDVAHRRGIVIDKIPLSNESYAGAHVFTPVPGIYDAVICLDFSSLYPSIIRALNLCFSTLIRPEQNHEMPRHKITEIEFEQEIEKSKPVAEEEENEYFKEEDDEEEETNKNVKKITVTQLKTLAKEKGVKKYSTMTRQQLLEALDYKEEEPEPVKKTETKHFYYEWVKKDVFYGIIPEIEDRLVGERKAVRKELEELEEKIESLEKKESLTEEEVRFMKDSKIICDILDKRQLALKVTANSVYGFLGNVLKAAASCVTFAGRQYIHMSENYCKMRYDGDIVYGDTDSIMVRIKGVSAENCTEWGLRLSKEITALFQNPFVFEYDSESKTILIKKSEYVTMDKYSEILQIKNLLEEKYSLQPELLSREVLQVNISDDKLFETCKKETNDLFRNPLNMEYEKSMRMIVFKKKKYASYLIDKDGKYKKSRNGETYILPRGIVIARRDNCPWIRETYLKLLRIVLDGKNISEAYNVIVESVLDLMYSKISLKQIAIVKTLGSDYKPNSTASMKLFGEELIRLGKPIQPGERIDYIIVNDMEGRTKIGYKMRMLEDASDEDFKESLDKQYYIKLLMNPLDQLFSVAYKDKIKELWNGQYYSEALGKMASLHYSKLYRKGKGTDFNTPVKMIYKMLSDIERTDESPSEFIEIMCKERLNFLRENV